MLLKERNKTQKLPVAWFRLYEISRKGKSIETEKQVCGYLGLGTSTECKRALGNLLGWWNILQLDHFYVNYTSVKMVGTANMLVFHPYSAPVTSTAGNQWLPFLTGRRLIAGTKHAKNIIMPNYNKTSLCITNRLWWNWLILKHLASKCIRHQEWSLFFCTGANDDTGFYSPHWIKSELKVKEESIRRRKLQRQHRQVHLSYGRCWFLLY